MLRENEIRELEAELTHCHDRRAASIIGLAAVQKSRGWVSDEAIDELSEYLGMTPHELDSVATFYNLIFRQPVGRHVILLCDGVVCWMLGGEDLKQRLFDMLGITYGGTTGDNRFTILPNACLGICHGAPAMMVDGDTYTDLTADKIEEILDKYE